MEGKKLTPEQQQLVLNNINLVYQVYHDTYSAIPAYIKNWEEDIIQEGMFGLCRAARAYDKEKYSTQFSTLAFPCIQHEMGRLIRKIKNDFIVDSLDEIIANDEDSAQGNNLLEMVNNNSITPDEIIFLCEMQDFVLNVLIGAPEKIRFIMKQILLYDKRPIDIYLEHFAHTTFSNVTYSITLAKRKLKKLWNWPDKQEFPREEDYISRLAFKEDMKRLWKCQNLQKFKRNYTYLKEQN